MSLIGIVAQEADLLVKERCFDSFSLFISLVEVCSQKMYDSLVEQGKIISVIFEKDGCVVGSRGDVGKEWEGGGG